MLFIEANPPKILQKAIYICPPRPRLQPQGCASASTIPAPSPRPCASISSMRTPSSSLRMGTPWRESKVCPSFTRVRSRDTAVAATRDLSCADHSYHRHGPNTPAAYRRSGISPDGRTGRRYPCPHNPDNGCIVQDSLHNSPDNPHSPEDSRRASHTGPADRRLRPRSGPKPSRRHRPQRRRRFRCKPGRRKWRPPSRPRQPGRATVFSSHHLLST